MKYYVSIGSRTFEMDVDGERITIGGETVRGRIAPANHPDEYVLRIGDAVHRVRARRPPGASRGTFELNVGGFRMSVDALDERARAIRALSRRIERPAGPMQLLAPMPGLVVRVNVGEGERVRAGQGLVVMEAMKMENELKAAAPATVHRIAVEPGSAVEKGTLLLELHPDGSGAAS